jgi:glycopeptide antibiotics resistance protein
LSVRKNPAILLTLLYLAFILYGTTIPFDLTTASPVLSDNINSIRWMPFQRAPGVRESIPDIASNLLLFIPLGLFICYAGLSAKRKRTPWSVFILTLTASAATSAITEAIQILSPSRITSLTDLLTNTIGAACGAVISFIFYHWARASLAGWCRREVLRSPAVLLLIVYASLLIIGTLVPLDASLDVDSIKQSLKSARLDPFRDPIPWSKVLGVLLWFAGLCYLLCHVLTAQIRRLPNILGILIALVISSLVALTTELAQIFIASRLTTTLDILAGTVGALYGGLLFALFNASALRGESSDHKLLRGGKLFWLALIHYLIYLVNEALHPYTFLYSPQLPRITLSTFLPFSSYYGNTSAMALFDFLCGIARFAPLGYLAQGYRTLTGKQSQWKSIAITLILGFFLEALQLGIAGRYADISDVIAAGCGGYVGFVVWRWYRRERAV